MATRGALDVCIDGATLGATLEDVAALATALLRALALAPRLRRAWVLRLWSRARADGDAPRGGREALREDPSLGPLLRRLDGPRRVDDNGDGNGDGIASGRGGREGADGAEEAARGAATRAASEIGAPLATSSPLWASRRLGPSDVRVALEIVVAFALRPPAVGSSPAAASHARRLGLALALDDEGAVVGVEAGDRGPGTLPLLATAPALRVLSDRDAAYGDFYRLALGRRHRDADPPSEEAAAIFDVGLWPHLDVPDVEALGGRRAGVDLDASVARLLEALVDGLSPEENRSLVRKRRRRAERRRQGEAQATRGEAVDRTAAGNGRGSADGGPRLATRELGVQRGIDPKPCPSRVVASRPDEAGAATRAAGVDEHDGSASSVGTCGPRRRGADGLDGSASDDDGAVVSGERGATRNPSDCAEARRGRSGVVAVALDATSNAETRGRSGVRSSARRAPSDAVQHGPRGSASAEAEPRQGSSSPVSRRRPGDRGRPTHRTVARGETRDQPCSSDGSAESRCGPAVARATHSRSTSRGSRPATDLQPSGVPRAMSGRAARLAAKALEVARTNAVSARTAGATRRGSAPPASRAPEARRGVVRKAPSGALPRSAAGINAAAMERRARVDALSSAGTGALATSELPLPPSSPREIPDWLAARLEETIPDAPPAEQQPSSAADATTAATAHANLPPLATAESVALARRLCRAAAKVIVAPGSRRPTKEAAETLADGACGSARDVVRALGDAHDPASIRAVAARALRWLVARLALVETATSSRELRVAIADAQKCARGDRLEGLEGRPARGYSGRGNSDKPPSQPPAQLEDCGLCLDVLAATTTPVPFGARLLFDAALKPAFAGGAVAGDLAWLAAAAWGAGASPVPRPKRGGSIGDGEKRASAASLSADEPDLDDPLRAQDAFLDALFAEGIGTEDAQQDAAPSGSTREAPRELDLTKVSSPWEDEQMHPMEASPTRQVSPETRDRSAMLRTLGSPRPPRPTRPGALPASPAQRTKRRRVGDSIEASCDNLDSHASQPPQTSRSLAPSGSGGLASPRRAAAQRGARGSALALAAASSGGAIPLASASRRGPVFRCGGSEASSPTEAVSARRPGSATAAGPLKRASSGTPAGLSNVGSHRGDGRASTGNLHVPDGVQAPPQLVGPIPALGHLRLRHWNIGLLSRQVVVPPKPKRVSSARRDRASRTSARPQSAPRNAAAKAAPPNLAETPPQAPAWRPGSLLPEEGTKRTVEEASTAPNPVESATEGAQGVPTWMRTAASFSKSKPPEGLAASSSLPRTLNAAHDRAPLEGTSDALETSHSQTPLQRLPELMLRDEAEPQALSPPPEPILSPRAELRAPSPPPSPMHVRASLRGGMFAFDDGPPESPSRPMFIEARSMGLLESPQCMERSDGEVSPMEGSLNMGQRILLGDASERSRLADARVALSVQRVSESPSNSPACSGRARREGNGINGDLVGAHANVGKVSSSPAVDAGFDGGERAVSQSLTLAPSVLPENDQNALNRDRPSDAEQQRAKSSPPPPHVGDRLRLSLGGLLLEGTVSAIAFDVPPPEEWKAATVTVCIASDAPAKALFAVDPSLTVQSNKHKAWDSPLDAGEWSVQSKLASSTAAGSLDRVAPLPRVERSNAQQLGAVEPRGERPLEHAGTSASAWDASVAPSAPLCVTRPPVALEQSAPSNELPSGTADAIPPPDRISLTAPDSKPHVAPRATARDLFLPSMAAGPRDELSTSNSDGASDAKEGPAPAETTPVSRIVPSSWLLASIGTSSMGTCDRAASRGSNDRGSPVPDQRRGAVVDRWDDERKDRMASAAFASTSSRAAETTPPFASRPTEKEVRALNTTEPGKELSKASHTLTPLMSTHEACTVAILKETAPVRGCDLNAVRASPSCSTLRDPCVPEQIALDHPAPGLLPLQEQSRAHSSIAVAPTPFSRPVEPFEAPPSVAQTPDKCGPRPAVSSAWLDVFSGSSTPLRMPLHRLSLTANKGLGRALDPRERRE